MSLQRMVLRDFVIVDTLDLELATGFTVLTGETGAGKSILIDALQLVTGGRADVNLIREGATRTEVTAEFDVNESVRNWLDDAGFDQDANLTLRRTVDSQGKSRAWINASPATATQLRAVGEQLLDIHGQHAWQCLTRPDAVRALLDAYAQIDTSATAASWHRWRDAQTQLMHARTSAASLQTERERLMWQIGELEKLGPGLDEWEQLNTEHHRLANAQGLIEGAQTVLLAIDENDQSARSQVGTALDTLEKLQQLDPYFKGLCDVLTSSLAQLEDVVHSIHGYLRKTEPDPTRLGELDARLGLWISLARRYKRSPHELPTLLSQWRSELQALDAAADLDSLETAQEMAWQNYLTEAGRVTQARQCHAPKLASTITQAMQSLGMQGGKFEVCLQAATEPMQCGMEDVGFLVAGHTGSTPRPIGKVASGGELSRIALAIAITTSQLGLAQTLIFDEVDAGVGGAVAETVGRLMCQLGRDRQVLAVTHLPQVAACANQHLVVNKRTQGNQTLSQVQLVTAEQRVGELARMLGGERLMDSTLAHARDLLQSQTV